MDRYGVWCDELAKRHAAKRRRHSTFLVERGTLTPSQPTRPRRDCPRGRAGYRTLEVAMTAFISEAENRPGEIAGISEALGEQGINITAIGSIAWGERGAIGLMTSDPEGARDAFDRAGLSYREVETVEFRLEDRPGTLAEASRRLANAGVNVEFLVPTHHDGGQVTLQAGVDNAMAARQALGPAAAILA